MADRHSTSRLLATLGVATIGIAFSLAAPGTAYAHCDTLDGPVVTDARAALDHGNPTPALKWVSAEDEQEVRATFAQALVVRALGPEAKEMADRLFFETVVRLHRAAEGAPFTGLRPAGAVEPSVAAADRAIAAGNVDDLAGETAQAAQAGVRERFAAVAEAARHRDESVLAGRRYVAAYVEFVHYVERLHTVSAAGPGHVGHAAEGATEGSAHSSEH